MALASRLHVAMDQKWNWIGQLGNPCQMACRMAGDGGKVQGFGWRSEPSRFRPHSHRIRQLFIEGGVTKAGAWALPWYAVCSIRFVFLLWSSGTNGLAVADLPANTGMGFSVRTFLPLPPATRCSGRFQMAMVPGGWPFLSPVHVAMSTILLWKLSFPRSGFHRYVQFAL